MIQLEYLSHSSFLLTCGNTRIVLDPWLEGSAYFNQWFLWPVYPGNLPTHFDAILISHGHEDHLHNQSLKKLAKSAHVFFPFQWRKGIKPYLNHLGFNEITEAVSFRTYELNDVKITYLAYSLESVVVIEYQGCVVVNINDALNSNHHNVADFLLTEINKRWTNIDYLLSGWSGAGYFPNQVRYPGKNDIEIAKLREQYFANNFCRFTKTLNPKISIPFVTGFVLLTEQNKWINHIKFPRRKIDQYFTEHYGNTRTKFIVPYPGDLVVGNEHKAHSHLHQVEEEEMYHLSYEHYKLEEQQVNTIQPVNQTEVGKLMKLMTYWINHNKQLYSETVLQDAVFSVFLEDAADRLFINIWYENGVFHLDQSQQPLPNRKALITTQTNRLSYALQRMWGGDAISIGYGHIIELYDEKSLEKNLDIVFTRLITRYPIAKQDLIKNPLRVAQYYLRNPTITTLWLKQKLKLKAQVNKYPYNERDHWFTYSKCDLCAVCKMPVVDNHQYNTYQTAANY